MFTYIPSCRSMPYFRVYILPKLNLDWQKYSHCFPTLLQHLKMCWIHAHLRRRWKWGVAANESGKRFLKFHFLYSFSFFSLHPSQLDKQKQSVIDKMSSNYSPRIMFSNRSSFIICRGLIKAFLISASMSFSLVRQEKDMEKS